MTKDQPFINAMNNWLNRYNDNNTDEKILRDGRQLATRCDLHLLREKVSSKFNDVFIEMKTILNEIRNQSPHPSSTPTSSPAVCPFATLYINEKTKTQTPPLTPSTPTSMTSAKSF